MVPLSLSSVVKVGSLVGGWLAVVTTGFLLLLQYKGVPGPASVPAESWPTTSRLALDPQRLTLVMLAHPRCPCTRASLDSLARLLARFPRRASAHVVFLSPEGWEDSDLQQTASAISGLQVHSDPDGQEARHFGAATSGHVLVYRPDGRLLFSGGLTPARGHAGDNLCLDRLLAVFSEETPVRAEAPVFGCPLHSLSSQPEKEIP